MNPIKCYKLTKIDGESHFVDDKLLSIKQAFKGIYYCSEHAIQMQSIVAYVRILFNGLF